MMRGIVFNALRVADIALIMLSFGLAAVFTFNAGHRLTVASFLASEVRLSSCVLFAIAILLCHAVFSLCGLYESKRMATKMSESADVVRAMTFSTACIWLEGRLFSVSVVTPYFLAGFWALGTALIIWMRFLLRQVLAAIRKRGRNLHHVLVLGTNARAIEFGRGLEGIPDRGYRLLGFVDDDWPGMEKFCETGLRLVCGHDGLPKFLRQNVVDEVAIYLPIRSLYERAAEIARLAKQHGILLRFDTDIFDLKFARRQTELLDGPPQITVKDSGIDGWPLLFKRLLDITGSLALLVILSPLLFVVALLVKITSPGPVLFA